MSNEKIRIILADDHKIVRESWKVLLENNPRFKVVADCSNGKDAIERARELSPDIILIDINMPPVNGFDVAEKIIDQLPGIKVIGLSVNNQPKFAVKMMEMGGKGFLTKTSPLEEINHGITEIYNGNLYICEEIKKQMPLAK